MKKLTIICSIIILLCLSSFKEKNTSDMYPSIASYLKKAEKDFNKIPAKRKAQLKKVAVYLKAKLDADNKANLVFICTHNSRRSHMGQLWAYAAAEYYGIEGVSNFSGGTENTAFNDRAVKALQKAGFEITKKSEGTNPHYEVKYAVTSPVIEVFSKKYTADPNPKTDFAAIMTCSEADKNCPVVFGAAARIVVPYEDPKEADGKPNEITVYDERCKQIATEVLYAFSLVNLKDK